MKKPETEFQGVRLMNELITRIAEAAGLDAATAQQAIGVILAFLQKEGPEGPVQQLLAALPGADALVAAAGQETSGGGLMGMLGGLMGGSGGIMALGQQLMGQGLDMGQIQTLAKELFAHGSEKMGEDVMGQIVASIPGLNQFS
jgi:hypothetical protein